MQWIQQLLVDSQRTGIVDVPPPILSRVFQELTTGIIQLSKMQNIKDVQFPFPYSQMVAVMLMLHWIVTPLAGAVMISSVSWAGILSFSVVGALWSLLFIAQELDMPFGHDANDLPVVKTMKAFNTSLLVLVHPMSQSRPEFDHVPGSMVTIQNVSVEAGNAEIKWDLPEASEGRHVLESEEAYAPIQRDMAEFQMQLIRGRKKTKHRLASTINTRSTFACVVSEVSDDAAAMATLSSLRSMVEVASSRSVTSAASDVRRAGSDTEHATSQIRNQHKNGSDTCRSEDYHDGGARSCTSSVVCTLLSSRSLSSNKSSKMVRPGANERRRPATSTDAMQSGKSKARQSVLSPAMPCDVTSQTTRQGIQIESSSPGFSSERKLAPITSSSNTNSMNTSDMLSPLEPCRENATLQFSDHAREHNVRC
eukprot:TRINITY_DN29504_c0_g1_i1.p1 TRINITY_DN29504_c0_g1~~TRINITY_DN29504_c0_g1_i1.p1  ORF type:complete len:423 (+),score=60.31 TRINITY_DN29504_c0_g1_i1:280-1548(+)